MTNNALKQSSSDDGDDKWRHPDKPRRGTAAARALSLRATAADHLTLHPSDARSRRCRSAGTGSDAEHGRNLAEQANITARNTRRYSALKCPVRQTAVPLLDRRPTRKPPDRSINASSMQHSDGLSSYDW